MLADDLGALPRQVAEFSLPAWGDEAPFQQGVLQQLGDPLAVLHVGLVSGNVLQVLRVDQQHCKLPFQNVADRFPGNASRFHGHLGHALDLEHSAMAINSRVAVPQ